MVKREQIILRSIYFIVAGLLIAVLFWQCSQNRKVSLQYLDNQGVAHQLLLSIKDRKKLEGLMHKLFVEDNFAYTILGNKPVSWATFLQPLPLSNWKKFCGSFSKYNRTIRSEWKTWEKYRYLFPYTHLWLEHSKCHRGFVSIFIINEETFDSVVNRNKRDFQEVLSREIVNGYQLIRESKNRLLMDEVLQGHQGLIGIVLGYGRDNSWQFLEGCKNHVPIGWVWEEDQYCIGESSDCHAYSCPSFAGNSHSIESLALKTDYRLTKQKILNYYKNKDFLEATLSLLAGYTPK